MIKTPMLAIAFFAALGLTAVHTPDAEAAGGSRTAARTNTRQARTPARTRTQSRTAQSRTTPTKNVNHLATIKSEIQKWTKWTLEGKPGSGGNYDFHAAQAELFSASGRQTQVRPLDYGKGSERIKVTGLKDNVWHGHLVGTVSVHDLASLPDGKYQTAVKDRVKSDRVRVSYDYGPGTKETVVAQKVKSEIVTAVPLKIPLNPKQGGVTRVIYNRTNANGQVVGSSSAYEGRIVEIVQ